MLAAVTIVIESALPALASSSWAWVAENEYGANYWVQKHNWEGRFRAFDVHAIGNDGLSKYTTKYTADCSNWRIRPSSGSRWDPALGGTLGDAYLKYVCN